MCTICETRSDYLKLVASAAAEAVRYTYISGCAPRAAAEASAHDLADRSGLNADDLLPDILQMMEAEQAGGTGPE